MIDVDPRPYLIICCAVRQADATTPSIPAPLATVSPTSQRLGKGEVIDRAKDSAEPDEPSPLGRPIIPSLLRVVS